jgi:hypothetical protein
MDDQDQVSPLLWLQHLDECSLCFADDARPDQYMTIPFMSTGKSNANSAFLWFQKVGTLCHLFAHRLIYSLNSVSQQPC